MNIPLDNSNCNKHNYSMAGNNNKELFGGE